MEIVNGENPNKVTYFDIRDFIEKIKLEPYVLEHMEETNKEFDEYMKRIKRYDYDELIDFWLMKTAEELVSSYQIERHYIDKQQFLKQNLFFDTLDISHQRLHDIHNFVMENENSEITNDYRKNPARVSYIDKTNVEHIYWHAPEPEDVPRFMQTFLQVYKSNDLSVINSNPFLKSALIKLLFIRIHPYGDGNGRTSRILYSIKFTEAVNKIYERKLKLCPLNISTSILINQYRYVNILDNIYFDIEHDNNEYINKWFDFILTMNDEQLLYLSNQMAKLDDFDYTSCLHNITPLKAKELITSLLYDIEYTPTNEQEEGYRLALTRMFD